MVATFIVENITTNNVENDTRSAVSCLPSGLGRQTLLHAERRSGRLNVPPHFEPNLCAKKAESFQRSNSGARVMINANFSKAADEIIVDDDRVLGGLWHPQQGDNDVTEER
jgi:hypothetical protein